MTQAEIEALRREIGAVDEEIIRLVAKRMEIAREVGRTKRKSGMEIRDPTQEERVVCMTAERAEQLGVREDTAVRIARALIDGAVGIQGETEDVSLRGVEVLVVGAGRMGAWISRFVSNRGANVSVFDPRGALDGYINVKSIDGIAPTAGMIIIASPLGTAKDDIRQVLSLKPSGTVFDLCSVKSHIQELLIDAAKHGLKVTSVHPMFGPRSPTPKGENLLICSCGCSEADAAVRALFERSGANVSDIPLERHDGLIATVLGLPHLSALLFGKTAMLSGSSFEELSKVQGPSFRRLCELARDTASESRRVYHDIQRLNPDARATMDSMASVLAELRAAALEDDPAKFRSAMDEQKRYFGGGGP